MRKNILQTLFLALLLILSVPAFGQGFWITSVMPSPSTLTDCAPSSADIQGNLPGTNYSVCSTMVTIAGSTITIDLYICSSGIGNPVIIPFSHLEPLGTLAAGNYAVTTNYFLNGSLNETHQTTFPVTSCCGASASFTVSNDSVCLGDTLFLTNTSTGAFSYTWLDNGSSFSSQINETRVYSVAGSHNIQLVAADSSCSDTASMTVEAVFCCPVVAAFSISPNLDTLCAGDTVSFQNNSSGATNYTWLNNGGNFSNGNTPDPTDFPAGTYNIQLIASDGNCSDTTVKTIVVINCCSVTAGFTVDDSTLCAGDSASFVNASQGGVNYTWLQNGSSFSSDPNPTLAFPNAGTYSISMIASGGPTCSDTAYATVYVNPIPNPVFQVIDNGNLLVTFTDQTPMSATSNWDFGDGNTGTGTITSHTYPAAGMYYVCLSMVDSFGCAGSSCDSITVGLLDGFADPFGGKYKVYPNPAEGVLFVELPETGMEGWQLDLWGMRGQRAEIEILQESANKFRLETADIPAGIYLLRLRSEDKIIHQKIIVR